MFHVGVAPAVTYMVRACGAKFPAGPDLLDAFFHHLQEKHEDEINNRRWLHLNNWVRKGVSLAPDPQYWTPSMEEPNV